MKSLIEWIPVASLAVAIVALFVSLLNRRTANHALRLSEAQESRRAPALVVRIDDLVKWSGHSQRWVAVKVVLTNSSDRDGSVPRVLLETEHHATTGNTVVRLISAGGSAPPGQTGQVLEAPVNLSANSSVAGWLLFRIDLDTQTGPVDDYRLVVEDSRGPVITTSVWPLRELT